MWFPLFVLEYTCAFGLVGGCVCERPCLAVSADRLRCRLVCSSLTRFQQAGMKLSVWLHIIHSATALPLQGIPTARLSGQTNSLQQWLHIIYNNKFHPIKNNRGSSVPGSWGGQRSEACSEALSRHPAILGWSFPSNKVIKWNIQNQSCHDKYLPLPASSWSKVTRSTTTAECW